MFLPFVQLAHDNKFNQHSVTFVQLSTRVVKAAHHLRQVGVHKGSRCAVLFDISESAIINILAIISLGAVAVLANRQIPPHILSQMFKRYISPPFI
jgi:acyl-coenzyme A synthetase/AMP-(fatty) acid ligase